MFYALFITYSRTGIVIVLVGVAFICLVFVLNLSQEIRTKIIYFGFIMSIIFSLFVFSVFLFDIGRYYGLVSLGQDDSLQTRFRIWKTVLPLITESPLIGYGPSRAGLLMREQFGSVVDSGILRWWYHYGILGVGAVLFFFISIFRDSISLILREKHFTDYPLTWSAIVVTGGWIPGALLVWIFLPVMRYSRSFTLFLILSCVVISRTIIE